MKKFVCVALALFTFALVFAAPSKGDIMYVSVRETSVKKGTGNFDKVLAKAVYGDSFTVLGMSGTKWILAKKTDGSVEGWIPASSLTSKKIVASANKGKVSASADEIALAGKGFSEQVENQYRSEKNLNYSAVDQMEKITVKQDTLKQFIVDGKLKGAEEDAESAE